METPCFPAMEMPSRCGRARCSVLCHGHKGETLRRSSEPCLLVALFSCFAWKPGHEAGQVIPVSALWVHRSAAGD